MLVSEVLDFSAKGEIKQLSVAKIADTDIDHIDNIATLISYLNLGLIALYKKFALLEVTNPLTNVVDGASYAMPDTYLYTLYVRAVVDGQPDAKPDIPINDEFSDFNFYEPSPFVLQVTKDDDKYSNITSANQVYVATPTLMVDVGDTVPLAHQYIDPLLLYMAHKAHSSLPNNENAPNHNNFYSRYLGACNEITTRGIHTENHSSNYKLTARGYA